MKLGNYLTKKQITSERFAKQLRVSVSSVNKWRMTGYRIPRAGMIARISVATRGRVELRDWYH
jgi:DNA-binding transcriptional regulator YdaS (Cro superfamily)